MAFTRNGGGQRGGKSKTEYVYSSSLTQNICYDGGKDAIKVADELKEGESREINITLTGEKTEQLLDIIDKAQKDPDGDGGLRITIYIKETENEKTGEVFDSASMMILGKFPPKNNNRRGGGSFRGNGGGGRKSYGNTDQEESRSANRGQQTRGDEGNDDADQDTNRSGRNTTGRSQGSTTGGRGGRGQTAQKTASRSRHDEDSDAKYERATRGKQIQEEYEPVDSPYTQQDDVPF